MTFLPDNSDPAATSLVEKTEEGQEENIWSDEQFNRFVIAVWNEAEPKLKGLLKRAGADAQDIAHDGVVKFLKLGRERLPSTVETRVGVGYLLTICTNLAIDRHRHLQRIIWLSLDYSGQDEEKGEIEGKIRDDGIEIGIINRDLCTQILTRLNKVERQLLIWRHIAGMTPQEIADLQKVSLGCVYTRLCRAEQRACKIFEEIDKR